MSGRAGTEGAPAGGDRFGRMLRTFLLSPVSAATWRSLLAILVGLLTGILAVNLVGGLLATGGSLLVWIVGIPILALGIESARLIAWLERRRMAIVDPRPLAPHAYQPLNGWPRSPYGPWLRRWAEVQFLDANRWRDVVYGLLLFPLAAFAFIASVGLWLTAVAFILAPAILGGLQSARIASHLLASVPVGTVSVVVVPVGLLLIPVAASVTQGLMVLQRAVVQGLLCVDETAALRQDVARLRGSRSAALELEANELRRIERDLHDGAQQRLVALTIDLGLAEAKIDSDPAAAHDLVAGAREQARQALAELRTLVRGATPAILQDRGLVAALDGVVGGCPVPGSLESHLPPDERLPAAVERAAYFVVAESLANVAKHSGAQRCEVRLRREAGSLVVEIEDDGAGGATVVPGGGIAGLRDRVEAMDGRLDVSSPPGGPTVIRATMPVG